MRAFGAATGSFAVTVAVRGTSRRSASSPNTSSGPSSPSASPSRLIETRPSSITYTRSPSSPCVTIASPAAARRSPSDEASRLSAAYGNGEKTVVRWRSSSSAARTSMPSSTCPSGAWASTARRARSAPAAISAPREPSRSFATGATSAPIPTAAITTSSNSPKMRPITFSSACSCMLVNPETSSRLLARPESARHTTATGVSGQTPITTSGRPHPASDSWNGRPSRPRPTSEMPASAPRMPPTPNAAVRIPTPDSPIPRSSIARTTSSTPRTPRTNAWAPNRPTTSRTGGFPTNARAPSRSSWRTPGCCAAAGPTVAEGRIPAIATNDRNEAAAQAPKTAAGVDTARISAAAAGPSNTAVDSNVSAATFEAASSRGVRASSGASARWHGRCAASGTAARIAST